MNSINEIISNDERIVAVFTTHDEWSSSLKFNPDGTGYTGDWVIRQNPNVETLVIYHRVLNENNIYKADIASIEGPLPQHKESNRFKINFNNLKYLGTTNSKWPEFANCGSNPVRYINT